MNNWTYVQGGPKNVSQCSLHITSRPALATITSTIFHRLINRIQVRALLSPCHRRTEIDQVGNGVWCTERPTEHAARQIDGEDLCSISVTAPARDESYRSLRYSGYTSCYQRWQIGQPACTYDVPAPVGVIVSTGVSTSPKLGQQVLQQHQRGLDYWRTKRLKG